MLIEARFSRTEAASRLTPSYSAIVDPNIPARLAKICYLLTVSNWFFVGSLLRRIYLAFGRWFGTDSPRVADLISGSTACTESKRCQRAGLQIL